MSTCPQPPQGPQPPDTKLYDSEALRLEYVTTCVGFDDILNITLPLNLPHVDHCIVVTTHDDRATHGVARKYGATLIQTDLFSKNGRKFNKGAAINAGMDGFHYYGWRAHIDCDIILPDNFRRMLFNHTHLHRDCIYGADRVDVIGRQELTGIMDGQPQHRDSVFVHPKHNRPISPRFVDHLHSWAPLGFFQLWSAKCQKPYPFSLGDASHDDVAFSTQWPESHRRLIPSIILYHLCSEPPKLAQNWEGRKSKRFD